MVIHDNMGMFDLAVECGATIATRNNLNLNPLTVAAYLAHEDMFFHIANIEREVYWQIGKYFELLYNYYLLLIIANELLIKVSCIL